MGEVLQWNEDSWPRISGRADRIEEWVYRAENRVAGGRFCQFVEDADDS
jgi:hypothetical protein